MPSMHENFFDKCWHELTPDELANAHIVYHQALVRFFKAMGENPFTPENHRRLMRISSASAAHCRRHAERAHARRMTTGAMLRRDESQNRAVTPA